MLYPDDLHNHDTIYVSHQDIPGQFLVSNLLNGNYIELFYSMEFKQKPLIFF